jgi:hypothetical protein
MDDLAAQAAAGLASNDILPIEVKRLFSRR